MARCHSFCYFLYFTIYIHSFNNIHTIHLSFAEVYLHIFIAVSSVGKPPCGAENQTRACLTASRRSTNWATELTDWTPYGSAFSRPNRANCNSHSCCFYWHPCCCWHPRYRRCCVFGAPVIDNVFVDYAFLVSRSSLLFKTLCCHSVVPWWKIKKYFLYR